MSEIIVVENEKDLLKVLIIIVQKLDPDIVAGWDIEQSSLSYIGERFAVYHDVSIFDLLSRCPHNMNNLINIL